MKKYISLEERYQLKDFDLTQKLADALKPLDKYYTDFDECGQKNHISGSHNLFEDVSSLLKDERVSEDNKNAVKRYAELDDKFHKRYYEFFTGGWRWLVPSRKDEWEEYLAIFQSVVDAAPEFVSAICAYKNMLNTPASN